MDKLKELYAYRQMLISLVKKDLRGRYKASVLGFFWTFINPLLQLLVYTVVFSVVMRAGIEKFYIFVFVALVPWIFFSSSLTGGANIIVMNQDMIQKIYFPRIILPISYVTSCFVNMLFSLGAVLIVMIFAHAPFHWTILLIPIPLFLLLVFCCGIGSILAALTVFFRDVIHLYSVCTLALMYLTPIFYPIDSIPLEISRWYYLNPMVHYLSYFRNLVLYGTLPTVAENFACIGISALTFAFGMFIFSKMQKRFAFYL